MQKDIYQSIKQQFPYDPTDDQEALIHKLSEFISSGESSSLFVLKGYAGTGKTTIVSSLVNILPSVGLNYMLLAPTGRAAKVLAAYAGRQAYTIHKKIYRLQTDREGALAVTLQKNTLRNTIFVVDEASMIPWNSQPGQQASLFGGASLLDDLLQYVYNGKGCRLIFIGDTAQLPPVFSLESPALDVNFLRQRYHLIVNAFELKQVVRQSLESGILYNATSLRKMLASSTEGFPEIQTTGFSDVIRVQGQDAADEVDAAFTNQNREEALMICRSNKRANMYNRHIRQRVLFMEDEINAGDLLMVVKNNYFWLPENTDAGFIANGDILEIKRIVKREELYGFRFADVTVQMTDYPEMPDLDVKIMLDTLDADGPALSRQESTKLFETVAEDYSDIAKKSTRIANIRKNPYLNALQVKHAYALTCHKAQGGQWKNVFVEMGYIPGKTPDTEYLRWLYTAFTRATQKIFLLNFSDDFFP